MVGLGRFELPTYGLGNRRSIHLSYSPINNLRTVGTFRVCDVTPRTENLASNFEALPEFIIRNHLVKFKRSLDVTVAQDCLNKFEMDGRPRDEIRVAV